MKRSAFLCLMIVLLAGAALAQTSPEEQNLARGFSPDKVYDFLGLDSVDRFSGNLNIRIPLGQEYHGNGKISYQFVLHYNSHMWDYNIGPPVAPPEPEDPCPGASANQVTSYPSRDSNAGLGWMLTLGSLTAETYLTNDQNVPDPPFNCDPANNETTCVVYVTPDGSKHRFSGRLHPNDQPDGFHYYTNDNTFIRATVVSDTQVELEFADGTGQSFRKLKRVIGQWYPDASEGKWRLVTLNDRFNNAVDITYEKTVINSEIWHITDGDRTHTVSFKEFGGYLRVLDRVDLAAFDGHRAVYELITRTHEIALGAGQNTDPGGKITVPVLTRIKLPDDRAYDMTNPDGSPAYETDAPISGLLDRLGLPTGGAISWTWADDDVLQWPSGRDACNHVFHPVPTWVWKRTVEDGNGANSVWQYWRFPGGNASCTNACKHGETPPCLAEPRHLISTVTQPDNVTNVAYFSVYNTGDKCPAAIGNDSWKRAEYGLPLTHMSAAAGGVVSGAYPSTEVRTTFNMADFQGLDIPMPPTSDDFFQRTYVHYEWEPNTNPVSPRSAYNIRRDYERTVYAPTPRGDYGTIANCANSGPDFCGETAFKNWDGLGHYRQTSTRSNLPGSVLRTTFVNHTGTLDTGNVWVLYRPTDKCVFDEEANHPIPTWTSCSGHITTALQWTAGWGVLHAQRVFGDPTGQPTTHDVLSIFEVDFRGNPTTESFYGGDTQEIAPSGFVPGAPAAYQINHTPIYSQTGMLTLIGRKSAYTNFLALTEDVELDPNTGKVAVSRDSAGLETKFKYDPAGRLTQITPPAPLARTCVDYLAATPPTINLRTLPVGAGKPDCTDPLAGTTLKAYDYDVVGRLVRNKTLMPDINNTTWSQVQTIYNETGQVKSVSTQQSVATFNANLVTQYLYDPSGKASRITAPDGSVITVTRKANGHTVTEVGTERHTEDQDGFGRLYSVKELSGPTSATSPAGAEATTTYGYDWADRLTKVTMAGIGSDGTQIRTFDYDARGFLNNETHPESGITQYSGANAGQQYAGYDARGHSHRRVAGPFDLGFDYDAAEHMTAVVDIGQNKPLKSFTFDQTNASGEYSAGKLRTATRHNYLAGNRDALVAETYTYAGVGGAVSKKETTLTIPGAAPQTFTEGFTYDDRGLLTALDYPTCAAPCATTGGIGRIDQAFSNNRLTSVSMSNGTTVFGSIDYNANGTVHTVTHRPGALAVTDTYVPDLTGMPRVSEIRVGGYCVGPAVNASEPTNKSITSGGTVQLTVTPPANATGYQWYQGTSGDTSQPVGTNSPTFTTPSLTSPASYWVRVAGNDGTQACSTDSRTATVNIKSCNEVTITTQPRDVTIAAGSSANLSVVAQGVSNVAYQWYRGTSGITTAILPGETNPSLNVSPTETTAYWVQVRAASCIQNSSTATVHICEAPSVIKMPTSQSFPNPPAGQTIAASAFVIAKGDDLTYAWRLAGADPSDPSTILSHDPVLNVTIAHNDTTKTYTCTITNRNSGLPSPCEGDLQVSVTFTIFNCEFTVNSNSYDPTVFSNIPLSVGAVGTGPFTFAWYHGLNGDATPLGGATLSEDGKVSTIQAGIGAQYDAYWCVVTSTTCGTSLISRRVYVNYWGSCPLPPVSVTPQSIVVGQGNTTTLTALVDWPRVKYQWYHGQTGDDHDPIDGATHSTLVVDSTPMNYWCRVTNECKSGHEDSATIVVSRRIGSTVCAPPTIVRQPESVDIAMGGSATLSVDANNPTSALTYSWYVQGSATAIPGETSARVTVTPPTSTIYYAKIHNACNETDWETARAVVRVATCPSITVTAQPVGGPVARTETKELHVSATSSEGISYQWYEGMVGDVTDAIAGQTSSTLVVNTPSAPLTATSSFWVRMRNSSCTIDSVAAEVELCDAPRFTQPPIGGNILLGAAFFLTGAATGTNIHYEWHQGTPEGPLVLNLDSLYIRPVGTDTYYLKVKGDCGTDIVSAPVVVTVCTPIQINTQPQSVTVFGGKTATLSVSASEGIQSTPIVYQWTDSSGNVVGTNSPTFTTPPMTTAKTYTVNMRAGACSIDSNPATVSICEFPEVIIAGSPRNIAAGQTITLQIGPMTPNDGNTIVWYRGPVGDVAGSTAVGSGDPLSVAPAASATYWATVSRANGCVSHTDAFTVNVCVPVISNQPQAGLYDLVHPVPLSVTASQAVSYQWYIGQSGDISTPYAGGTGASINVTPSVDTSYWVRVTSSCTTVDSASALVTVCRPPTITMNSLNLTVPRGTLVTLQTQSTGTNVTLQWYTGNSGDMSAPINGATGNSINVSPDNTTTYWARASGCGNANSVAVTVTVCATPSITTQPVSQTIYNGATATLSVAATEATTTPMTYQWYRGASGDSSTPVAGATSASFTTPALTSTTSYWVRVSNATCTPADSAAATVTVCLFTATVGSPSSAQTSVGQATNIVSPATGNRYAYFQGASGDTSHALSGWTNAAAYAVAPTVTTNYWNQVDNGVCVANSATFTVNVCVPTFTPPPSTSAIVNSGQSTTLNAAADTAGVTYQWYAGTSGTTTSPIAGATNSTYVTPALTAQTSYWVRATGSCGRTTDSPTITVSICQPASVTLNSPPTTIARGGSVTLQTQSSGTNVTLQWYVGNSGDMSAPIAGATGGSYLASPQNTTTYWVRATSQCANATTTANSAAVTITVCATPAITTQPTSRTIYNNTTTTLSVTATEATTTPMTYQWYRGASGDLSTPISGATGSSYTTPALTVTTNYWVRISNATCTPADSATATVTVCAYTATVGSAGSTQTSVGQTATITTPVSGTRYAYFQGTSGDTSHALSGWTAAMTYNVAPTATTSYWNQVDNGVCVANSATYTVNVCIPHITLPPSSVTINSGTTTTLTASADTAGVTYQWYIGTSGTTTSPISGATNASYTTPALTSTTNYWVRATSTCSRTVDSTTATVTICTPASITGQPQSPIAIGSGQTSSLTVAATGTGLSYQWYDGNSGDTTLPVSGATSPTLTVTAYDTHLYWVRVAGQCGSAVNSTAAYISVIPSITAQPQSVYVSSGSGATLTVASTGRLLHYSWRYGNGSVVSGGPDAARFYTGSLTATANYYCVVTTGTASATSQQATVSMCSGVTFGGSYVQNNGGCQRNVQIGFTGGYPNSYAWYQGARGDTTTLISNWSSADVCVSGSTTVWVRISITDPSTGAECYSDSPAITVQ